MDDKLQSIVYDRRMERIIQLAEWRRFIDAVQEAEDWIRDEPENADAYAALAFAYQFTDQDKALHWTEESLSREPDNGFAWRVRIAAAYEQEKWKLFEETAEEMKRLFPEDALAFRLQAQRRMVQGKLKEADELLHQALTLEANAEIYAVYAYCLAMNGRMEESREASDAALKEDPESFEVLLYTGWAADQRGEYELAMELMSTAVRLDPTNEQIRKEYVEVLQKSYWFYRILLLPVALRKLKPWQLLAIWVFCWIAFKPLLIGLIVLHIASYWLTKLLVHIKIFGFRRP